tara:strand:+ start:351 stop:656 length:306 start_codon:yes stop_codon:yes gene_type:complete
MEKLSRWFVDLEVEDFSPTKDEKTFDATLMKLIVVGEMTSKVSQDLTKKNPHVPWRELKDLRNLIAHEYLGIEARFIFNFVKDRLPKINENLEKIFKAMKS